MNSMTVEILLVIISLIVIIAYVGTILSQKENLKDKHVQQHSDERYDSWSEKKSTVLQKKILTHWEQVIDGTNKCPSYAYCGIRLKDDNTTQNVIIKLNTIIESRDDEIFYYCNGLEDFLRLIDSKEDFVLERFYYFTDIL